MMMLFWGMATLLRQKIRAKKRQLGMMVTLSRRLENIRNSMRTTLRRLSLKHRVTVKLAILRLKLAKT